jgi:aryl-alcohol dehydrogenase (NADP+)
VIVDRVAEVAGERGVPMAQIATAWMLSKPAVTAPIIGATKPHHIDDAVAAVDLVLDDDEIARLEEPYRPHAVAGFA